MQLTITFDPQTRAINVTGPIEDKFVCYAMLECARDAIRDHVAKHNEGQAPSRIVVPIPQMGRNGTG